MSNSSTQLDIKDTKLWGKSLRRIGTAAQVFELLHSPTVPLAMMSNAVAYQETSHDGRLTQSHSVSTAIGKAKQQLASATATATAPAISSTTRALQLHTRSLLSCSQLCRCHFSFTLLYSNNTAAAH
ncbi:hypothetical protein TRIATDRAFT_260131 [Trichoderma atroviride IMI 206040]|uniref:Uncharacterized protein n=1 Tax=Hypocrea atroviridis (strain ATCC 20476 / IMI 206040) TaxID=452589 RepID=G9P9Z6_HYPAI|nr:uncharacterized protein TRIATDRAFT_260131 [Trichoderma atroviride IMI 206040]EHK40467.1 hypothetical protein TRIATDRAFT_260131 [Trichoderma atroviride IMI 206040]